MSRRECGSVRIMFVFGVARLIKSVFMACGVVFSLMVGSNVYAHTVSLSTSGTITTNITDYSGAGGNGGASMSTDNVVVDSTCPLGYTLSIVGPTDSTLYKDGNSANDVAGKKIAASAGTVSAPVSILGANIGTWGYSLAAGATTSSNFIGLTDVLTPIYTKSTASASGGDIIAVHYGTSITTTTEPGTYTLAESSDGAGDNVIVYQLITNVNCGNYNIKYNDNGANSPTTMSFAHEDVLEGSTITLMASNFQKSGYGFAGWSTVPLDPDSTTFQTDLNTAVSDGKVFGPNQDVTLTQGFLNNAVLENGQFNIYMYAIWVKPAVGATFQNWNGCNSMSSGQVIALTDSRDNNVYAIAKLADDNCWMIENMRLDNSVVLSAVDTHNPSLPITNDYATGATSNSLSATSSTEASWCEDLTSACIDQSRLRTDNVVLASDVASQSNSVNVYSYGNYYNWYSATAGHGVYDIGGEITTPGDICPAGWHLPNGRLDGEFNDLGKALGGTDDGYMDETTNPTGAEMSEILRSYPINYIYSGRVNGDKISNRGTRGYYWSSTSGYTDSYDAGYADYDASLVKMGTDTYYMHVGRSVRCVASMPYTISFNANGGTGTMEDQPATVNDKIPLRANTFTRSGYVFRGWAVRSNGSVHYSDGEDVFNLAKKGETFTLYAKWSETCPAPGKLCYDDNGANSETTMKRQTISSTAVNHKLRTYNYKRDGYGFAGWSTEQLDPDDPDFNDNLVAAVNAGHVYGPNETITFEAGEYETMGPVFYAIWVPSAGNLQNWNSCSAMSEGQVTALTDSRDNNTYAIAKLADGNCWMIENLRLDNTVELSTLTTNNPNLPLTNDYADSITSNYLSPSIDPTVTAWCITLSSAACTDQSMFYNNTINVAAEINDSDMNVYGYGNYYNWYSATAGNGDYSIDTDGGAVVGDICPLGWHLPYGGSGTDVHGGFSSGGFSYLDIQLGGTGGSTSTNEEGAMRYAVWTAFPNNLVISGEIEENTFHSRGLKGSYWTENSRDQDYAYYMSFANSYVYPRHHSDPKSYGRSVRCITGN